MTRNCFLLALVWACFALALSVRAADAPAAKPPGTVSYFRDVRPIFQVHCQGCHQPAKAMGEYVMTNRRGPAQRGRKRASRRSCPASPTRATCWPRSRPADGKAEMPKDKEPLAEDQIELIRQWIAEGAEDDTPMSVRAVIDAEHPPVYEAPPVLTALDFSPDGTLLAVSGYHEVLLHKADGSGLVARLVGLSERIESVAFSPDGKSLAVTGGSPGRLGEVQVWDVGRAEAQAIRCP